VIQDNVTAASIRE